MTRRAATSVRVALAGLALAAGCSAFYTVLFRHVPVGMEARDFLQHGGLPGTAYTVRLVLGPEFRATRPVSMLSFRGMFRVCGYDAGCVNAVEVGLVALSGGLLLVLLFQLSGRLGASGLAAALWCFSLPVLNAVRWQATNHDKLALLFALVALSLAHLLLRFRGAAALLASNLLLLLPVAAALGSKESAFHLGVTLPALVLLFSPRRGPGRLVELARLVAPLAYVCVALGFYASELTEHLRAHALSGSPLRNLGSFAYALANLEARPQAGLASGPVAGPAEGPLAVAAVAALFALLAAGGALLLGRGGRALRDGRTLAFCAIFFASSLAIALRTRTGSAYYLYTPACGFAAGVVFAGDALLRGRGRAAGRRVLALPVAAGVLAILGLGFASNFAPGADTRVFLEATRNAAASDRAVRDAIGCRPGAVYHYVLPERRHWLDAFLFDGRDDAKDLILHFVLEERCDADLRFTAPGPAADRREGHVYVALGRDYELEGLWWGRERLLERPRSSTTRQATPDIAPSSAPGSGSASMPSIWSR